MKGFNLSVDLMEVQEFVSSLKNMLFFELMEGIEFKLKNNFIKDEDLKELERMKIITTGSKQICPKELKLDLIPK